MSGGTKYDNDKARFDLIPPHPLYQVAELFAMGAKKYDDRNWEKGLAWGRVFAAMMRHAWKWWMGEEYDEENGQHHLTSVAWCALVLLEYTDTHPELDDRSGKITPPADMLTKMVNLRPMPDYGDLMTMGEFLDYVKSGGITNDDGTAYLACEQGVTGIQVRPRDVLDGISLGTKFTHIAWFNK
jgi:hypothetical protein